MAEFKTIITFRAWDKECEITVKEALNTQEAIGFIMRICSTAVLISAEVLPNDKEEIYKLI